MKIDKALKYYEIESFRVQTSSTTSVQMFKIRNIDKLYKNPFTALRDAVRTAAIADGNSEDAAYEISDSIVRRTVRDTLQDVKRNKFLE